MLVESRREEVMRIISEKHLSATMNRTKWRALLNAVKTLPFPPPYQIKCINEDIPSPEVFDHDVWYWGDWSYEALMPFYAIEWICVRPTYRKHRGKLIDDMLVDETGEFISTLDQYGIPYIINNGTITIFGYQLQN